MKDTLRQALSIAGFVAAIILFIAPSVILLMLCMNWLKGSGLPDVVGVLLFIGAFVVIETINIMVFLRLTPHFDRFVP